MTGSNRFYSFIWHLVWPFFSFFHPCRLVGRERLPDSGGLFCANHSSDSDPFCIYMALGPRYQVRTMMKVELMKLPVVGFISKKCGFFAVERGKSDISAVKQAIRYLNEGEHVLIFPEGTRVRNGLDRHGNPGRPKTGAAMIAARTGQLVVPIYVPQKKRWFRYTNIIVGDPYPVVSDSEHPSSREYRNIAEDIMEHVYALGGKP